jgi:membrane protein implicated in regulation of membrane protease activity
MLVGLAFLVLAVAGASVAFSEWQYYIKSPSVGLVRFVLLASFTVLLVIFSLYSFAKARSIR